MYDAASNKMIFCHKYARIKGNSIVLVANIFFFKWIYSTVAKKHLADKFTQFTQYWQVRQQVYFESNV